MRTTVDHGLSPSQVQKIKSIVSQSAPEAERVALFGSRADGTYKNYSDIDLVIYGDVDRATINRLSTLFLESNMPYKVDVTAYKLVSYPPLKQHIDDHNKTLFTQTELNPVFAEAYHNRGVANQALGRTQEADEDFKMVAKLRGDEAL